MMIDATELRALSESSCSSCNFDEAEGELIAHCAKCCRRIVADLWCRTHQAERKITPTMYAALRAYRGSGEFGVYIRGRTGGAQRRMLLRMVDMGLLTGPPFKISFNGATVLAMHDARQRDR